jgi:3-dehydroquinate dehydratase type I
LKARVCVSILPKTSTEALKLIEKAEEAKADLIEVRLDRLDKHDRLADLASHGKTLKIATNKLLSCRGNFKGTETEQKQILLTAAKTGFNYVDIELSTSNLKEFKTQIGDLGAKLIVSFHDFEGTLKLTELDSVLEREIAAGADICKIVPTAKRIEDNLTLLNFCSAASKRCSVVCFAMGEPGKVSRLLSPLFGCAFTFAALESGSETASGQMTIQEMRSAYKLLGV